MNPLTKYYWQECSKEIRDDNYPCDSCYQCRNIERYVGKWLGQHRHPIQPYPGKNKTELSEDDWHMREISRQVQIDELLKELGLTKFDVISVDSK